MGIAPPLQGFRRSSMRAERPPEPIWRPIPQIPTPSDAPFPILVQRSSNPLGSGCRLQRLDILMQWAPPPPFLFSHSLPSLIDLFSVSAYSDLKTSFFRRNLSPPVAPAGTPRRVPVVICFQGRPPGWARTLEQSTDRSSVSFSRRRRQTPTILRTREPRVSPLKNLQSPVLMAAAETFRPVHAPRTVAGWRSPAIFERLPQNYRTRENWLPTAGPGDWATNHRPIYMRELEGVGEWRLLSRSESPFSGISLGSQGMEKHQKTFRLRYVRLFFSLTAQVSSSEAWGSVPINVT